MLLTYEKTDFNYSDFSEFYNMRMLICMLKIKLECFVG